jgi:hydrogenase maturation protein HypF
VGWDAFAELKIDAANRTPLSGFAPSPLGGFVCMELAVTQPGTEERMAVHRRVVLVKGTVQGVGFRPYVYELACRSGLRGLVLNRMDGVVIEVEGVQTALDRFLNDLLAGPPPLACIESVAWLPQSVRGDTTFRIAESDAEETGLVFIAADVATCDACLAELTDPTDLRYRYPFLNCTHCGPRLTIIRAMPYDRERTTMAYFVMCPTCTAEYGDPSNRRFHAQPIACPACGPQLAIRDGRGREVSCDDPAGFTASLLRDGGIVAIKGLGGYHLACDARSEPAVSELRRRKGRDDKPFAVMVADVVAAEHLCTITALERRLLLSWQRPIVLLRQRYENHVAPAVTSGNPSLGVMLPYTPLHHLLLQALEGIPLVMTSGNRTDEPIAYRDQEAVEQLAGITDFFLSHNRPIHLRCDDSVMQVVAGEELPLRRSRGYVPQPLHLPWNCPYPILALGGHLKVTFALGRDRQAILSHHLGDLDQYEAYRVYRQAIDHYEQLFALTPELIVHDLHPEYASTRYARERVQQTGVKHLAVQHHHAHLASCMADNGLEGPVIGVVFDGTGLGTDGAVWGGEFLVGDYRGFRRAAHLRYVPMPGGEQAIREPWRMALAHLHDAGEKFDVLTGRVGANAIVTVQRMIERKINTSLTSSVGRLFDAVAALAGIRQQVSYEGQAAMELEWRAFATVQDGSYSFGLEPGGDAGPGAVCQIDTRPLIVGITCDILNKCRPEVIARRFHSTLREIIARVCNRLREETGLEVVTLSGGVFMNALLLEETVGRLQAEGFRVYRHCRVPPNDGGLSLGQLAVAAATAHADSFPAIPQGEAHVPGHPR